MIHTNLHTGRPGQQKTPLCSTHYWTFWSKSTLMRGFVDLSSTFNTIRPYKLRAKLQHLRLNILLCNWIVDFLANNYISTPLLTNTGAPQGYVLSSMLYTLFKQDCPTSSPSSHFQTCGDTAMLGLISNIEMVYSTEVQHLATWCDSNNLAFNIRKKHENYC